VGDADIRAAGLAAEAVEDQAGGGLIPQRSQGGSRSDTEERQIPNLARMLSGGRYLAPIMSVIALPARSL